MTVSWLTFSSLSWIGVAITTFFGSSVSTMSGLIVCNISHNMLPHMCGVLIRDLDCKFISTAVFVVIRPNGYEQLAKSRVELDHTINDHEHI